MPASLPSSPSSSSLSSLSSGSIWSYASSSSFLSESSSALSSASVSIDTMSSWERDLPGASVVSENNYEHEHVKFLKDSTSSKSICGNSTSGELLLLHKGKLASGYMQFFENGTLIEKIFVNPSSGNLQFYKGMVASFDPLEGYYLIRYSDGDREELTEKEVMIYLGAWSFLHYILSEFYPYVL